MTLAGIEDGCEALECRCLPRGKIFLEASTRQHNFHASSTDSNRTRKKRTNRFQCHFRITPPEWTNGIHLLRQTMEDLKISHFLLYKNWFMTEKGENCWILLHNTKLVDLCGFFFFAGTFIVYVIRALVRLVHSSRLLVQKPVHKTWPFLFHFKVYAHLFFALDWVAHFMVLLELH